MDFPVHCLHGTLFIGRVLCILANRSMNYWLEALLDAKESVVDAGLYTNPVGHQSGRDIVRGITDFAGRRLLRAAINRCVLQSAYVLKALTIAEALRAEVF